MTIPERVPRALSQYYMINEQGDIEEKSTYEGFFWRNIGAALGLCKSRDEYCAELADAVYKKLEKDGVSLFNKVIVKVKDWTGKTCNGELIDGDLDQFQIEYLIKSHVACSGAKKIEEVALKALSPDAPKEDFHAMDLFKQAIAPTLRVGGKVPPWDKEYFEHCLTLVSNFSQDDSCLLIRFAVNYNNREALELLLQHPNIDVNAKGEGMTPLMHACFSNNPLRNIKLLVEGAAKAGKEIKWEAENKLGETAFDQVSFSNKIALKQKEEVLAYLREKMGLPPVVEGS